MAGREDGDIEQALGAALRDSSPGGCATEGGLGVHVRSLSPQRPCRARVRGPRGAGRRRGRRRRRARGRGRPSDRCADADAMPGQAPADDLRARHAVPDERRAHGPRARAPAGRAAAEPRGRRATRARWCAGSFFDHTSPGGSTMLARIRATSYLRDVTLVVGGREHRLGHRRRWPRRARWSAPGCTRPGTAPTCWTAASPTSASASPPGAPVALEPGELGGTYVTDFGRRLTS